MIIGRNVGTLRRGSSHVPTPQSATPLPVVIGQALRVQLSEVNRYCRYMRAHVKHFNSDSDVCWNRKRLYIKYKSECVFQCVPTPEAIKNAYCLLRLCDSNLSHFLRYLIENDDKIPNVFESPTPIYHSEVEVDNTDDT
jgi:hypothetical protein